MDSELAAAQPAANGVASDVASTDATSAYAQAISGEGEYWDNFVAQRLLQGELPGSLDWRLTITQFRYNHDWKPFCFGAPLLSFRLREMRYLLEQATGTPGMRVLDLGCGAGWLSLELARLGAHVMAVDISPSNLALARHMAATNARNFPFLYQRFAGLQCRLEEFGSIEYAYADLNTVELPFEEYDAVVVWDSLHHVAELERLLEQVRRTLKPGGSFIGLDHTVATMRDWEFNWALRPLIEDCYSWVTAADPKWFYKHLIDAAEEYDWGVLAVDYDRTPVPGFPEFLDTLRAELLQIVRKDRAAAIEPGPRAHEGEGESPFEDVSAERVKNVLLDTFQAEQFRTICPYILPEHYLPAPRSEKERIFQHYLTALLIDFGERAIARGNADGQWFMFHMRRDRPAEPGQSGRILNHHPDRRQLHIANLEALLNSQYHELGARLDYIHHLEAEVERKDKALADMSGRLKQREAELRAVRRPVLPWKRRRRD